MSSTFSLEAVKTALADINKLTVTYENEHTLNLVLAETKVSFFYYNYPLLFDLLKHKTVQLADKRDIAAMKLVAIAGRGTKRDFIDLPPRNPSGENRPTLCLLSCCQNLLKRIN